MTLLLLADSRPLFSMLRGRPLLDAVLPVSARGAPISAAYIGAANGDRPEFHDIFEAAVETVGITDRRMIRSSFPAADRAFLERAQLVVLAGGDVRVGWTTFESTGMAEVILRRYAEGAVLVGISAGAVQLGRYGIVETPEPSASGLLEVFGLVPAVVDTHDERAGWARLSGAVRSMSGRVTGLGIPSGGGVILHADDTVEPVGRPAHVFRHASGQVMHSLVQTATDGWPPSTSPPAVERGTRR